MIQDRPALLLARPEYKKLPDKAFNAKIDVLPELVRTSLGPLGGIQPVTGAMTKAANGKLMDMPSDGEIELFRKANTQFQMVFVVLSITDLEDDGEHLIATPYSVALIPASKRNAVEVTTIDLIAKLDVQKQIAERELCYNGFDPFSGTWTVHGDLSVFLSKDKAAEGFIDELGLVVGQYFLATTYDPADVLEVPLGLSTQKGEDKYRKHRAKLLYSPFNEVQTRRIWGAQSPIELFLLQELLHRGHSPTLQTLIYDDGNTYPSLYDLWRDIDFRHTAGLISEADMYLPHKKLAVFCDSSRHHRGRKAQAKDAAIDEKLQAIGVSSVRVPGKLIVEDLKAAADLVEDGHS